MTLGVTDTLIQTLKVRDTKRTLWSWVYQFAKVANPFVGNHKDGRLGAALCETSATVCNNSSARSFET